MQVFIAAALSFGFDHAEAVLLVEFPSTLVPVLGVTPCVAPFLFDPAADPAHHSPWRMKL